MSFARPEWLWLLAGVPVLVILAEAAHRRAASRTRSLDPRFPGAGSALRQACLGAAAAGLAVALAGPRWGMRETALEVPETDVVFLMDTSGSMLTRDVSPDRFSRVRAFARELLRDLPAPARTGLVRVEGEGEVLAPLTLDHVALANALGEVVPRGAVVPGSDLGDGLRKAEALLSSRGARGRAVVLFSDGEDLDANLVEQAAACRARGIVVDAVLVGTEGGGPVPARGGGFLLDGSGRPVLSHADASAMRRVASLTGGQFLDASPAAVSPALLAASLARLESGPEQRRSREPVDRSAWALGLAAAAWTGMLLPASRRAR